MDNQKISLNHQLQSATDLTAECEKHRSELVSAQTALHTLSQQNQEELARIQQASSTALQAEIQRFQSEAENELETFLLDHKTQTQSVRDTSDQTARRLKTQLAEEITELEDQRKSETWILQSVLDEDTDDSPVTQFDREVETYSSQKAFFDERSTVLDDRVEQARQLLASCRATVDEEPQQQQADKSSRDELRDNAIEFGDSVLTEADRIEGMFLPRWVQGYRLWGIAAVTFVAIWIPIIGVKANLRDFINWDQASPDWEWTAVAALISASVVFFVCLTLLLNLQSRLRSRFQAVIQNRNNAHHAQRQWEEKSEKHLAQLETSAADWQRQVEERRERQLAKIQTEIDLRIQAARNQADQQSAQLQADLEHTLQRLSDGRADMESHVLSRLDHDIQQTEARFHEELASAQASQQQKYDADTQELKQSAERSRQQWVEAVTSIRNLVQASRSLASTVSPLAHVAAPGWKLPETMPTCLSVGDILITTPQAPETVDSPTDTNLCVEMPGLLRFPTDTSLLVEHDSAGRETALSFLRMQLLKLLTSIPAGRIRLTLIDPVGLGQSFAAMMHLADFDELLIHSRIWTESSQIRNQLQKVTEHMENIFQTYLRSQFDTIEEYNASAGEVAEPYHFVVIAGFPSGFSEESAHHLSSILTSGPRCGVHALIAWNPSVGAPQGFDLDDLTNNCISLHVANDTIQPKPAMSDAVVFEAADEPPADEYVSMVRAVGEQSKDARRVEVSFKRISPRADEIWSHSTADGIDLPIGRAGAARHQFLRLGRGTSQHVLIAGKTGSGKSTFLHILITNLALHYSPDEIQFYLIDFKKGVEFRTYAANRLPHARVVAIESEREFGLSVLERLDEILQERGELFRELGVQDVPTFREAHPTEPMPRLLLLIDEFQEFFVAEDRVSSRASLLLDRLVRQGRAFGIHVLLGSQTLGGAYSLARSTMGQIAVRIALQCSESDAHLILSEDNMAARLLTRPGEAIYNDANGMVQGNHQFQVAWLTEDQREEAIATMLESPASRDARDYGMVVFEGNVAPTAEYCAPLNAHLKHKDDATRKSTDALTIWLGEPVAIAAPTCVDLRRTSGQNLLIVGQEEHLIDNLLAFVVLSTLRDPVSGENENRSPRLTLLHDAPASDSITRFQSLQAATSSGRLDIRPAAECEATVEQIFQEIVTRESSPDFAECPEHLLVIHNIGQFRELRKDEDSFGLGGFGEQKPETAADRLSEVIKRGPLVGVHVVVWSDTFNNAVRWLSNALMREFESRIAFRMNQTDSASLVDSPVAATLTQGRALVYRDQTGTIEKFRPFAWPSQEWLETIASGDSPPPSPEDFDIDSMRIE